MFSYFILSTSGSERWTRRHYRCKLTPHNNPFHLKMFICKLFWSWTSEVINISFILTQENDKPLLVVSGGGSLKCLYPSHKEALLQYKNTTLQVKVLIWNVKSMDVLLAKIYILMTKNSPCKCYFINITLYDYYSWCIKV